MSKSTDKSKDSAERDTRPFLQRLPDNLPFLPIVRRPDYQLRYAKVGLPTSIPVPIITSVILIGLLFIYVGGFFDLAKEPVAFGSDANQEAVVIASALDYQFLIEGLAAGFLMFIGAGGFFLIHYSTQYAYSPRNSTILLILGIGIVTACWIGVVFMLRAKLGM
jgi:hypothetical protein